MPKTQWSVGKCNKGVECDWVSVVDCGLPIFLLPIHHEVVMSEAFQSILADSLHSVAHTQEMLKTKRFQRLRYLAEGCWGFSPVTLGIMLIAFAVSATVFWFPVFATLTCLMFLYGAFVSEWIIQRAMKKCLNAYRIVSGSTHADVAQASYKLQVLEECKKSGATVEQMQELKKLALEEEIPHGWWTWVLNWAKASIKHEHQHTVSVQKTQAEQNALVQIQNIAEPIVAAKPLEYFSTKTLKI